ncbi:MAG: phosphatase PAP2 family protein [Actinomyces graevenitzii]|jgi:hypothetical protein|nr:phosphatase PAP2 family protein [Actinomyces graevenitzii]
MSKLARRIACVYALLFTLLVWGSWALLVNTREGQFIDDAAFKGSYWGAARIDDQARALLNAVSVPLIVVAIIATLAIALLRRRPRAALWATAVVVGTNVTIQALKHFVFTRPDWGYSQRVDAANTLPSGHTGVAASIAVALLLVVPPAWRVIAAWVGAGFTFFMGWSTLVCQWHRPSDIIAAAAVAFTWGFVALAAGAWGTDEYRGLPGSKLARYLLSLGGYLSLALVVMLASAAYRNFYLFGSLQFTAYLVGVSGFGAVSALGMSRLVKLGLK